MIFRYIIKLMLTIVLLELTCVVSKFTLQCVDSMRSEQLYNCIYEAPLLAIITSKVLRNKRQYRERLRDRSGAKRFCANGVLWAYKSKFTVYFLIII